MSRSDDCIWKSLTKNWRGGRANGFHRNRRPAGGTDYFLIMCCRRIREWISTFWSARAGRTFPGTHIDRKPSRRVRYVGISRAEKLLRRSKARRLTYVGQPSRLAPGAFPRAAEEVRRDALPTRLASATWLLTRNRRCRRFRDGANLRSQFPPRLVNDLELDAACREPLDNRVPLE